MGVKCRFVMHCSYVRSMDSPRLGDPVDSASLSFGATPTTNIPDQRPRRAATALFVACRGHRYHWHAISCQERQAEATWADIGGVQFVGDMPTSRPFSTALRCPFHVFKVCFRVWCVLKGIAKAVL